VRWIGHAGLASGRPGGTPTRLTLAGAAELAIDWLEIDVCRAADGTLVLRHDLRLPSGRPLRDLSLAEVRREDAEVLTLDDAAEVLEPSTVPTLIDLKDARDAEPVSRWLVTRGDPTHWAICSDDPDALRVIRDAAPQVQRWLSLPRVAPGRGEPLRRITACTLRSLLPARLGRLAAEVGAAAVAVDRWAVTPGICAAARRLGLPLAAWTVNSAPAARRMAACGVDLITSDRVAEMRAALGSQDGGATVRCDG
jgi:glycerophosphoryl diester phosphodiesterase